MSTMKVREPGKYCGPHKKLCKNIPDVEDLSEIKPPNPKGEFWIDGVNTFFNAPKGKQGIKHVENFNNVVETPAPPNTTTMAGPGMYNKPNFLYNIPIDHPIFFQRIILNCACLDPTQHSGYLWCATEVDANGMYISGKYKTCDENCN